MKIEDKEAFETWWEGWHDPLLGQSESLLLYNVALKAWEEAIAHEQNKPIRTYRWDGVLR